MSKKIKERERETDRQRQTQRHPQRDRETQREGSAIMMLGERSYLGEMG